MYDDECLHIVGELPASDTSYKNCFFTAAGSLCHGDMLLAQNGYVLEFPLDTTSLRYGPPAVFTRIRST